MSLFTMTKQDVSGARASCDVEASFWVMGVAGCVFGGRANREYGRRSRAWWIALRGCKEAPSIVAGAAF